MPQFDENHVKICGCTLVWDGITRPDKSPDGSVKYSLKVVIDPNNPDLALFHQLAQNKLQESKFKGVLPQGGLMPVGTAGPNEFGGMFTGFGVVSAKTKFMPDVYDEAGQALDPMQYGPMVFGGQKVDVLLHCYEYDKAGNRGISAGLDAFAIIVSANAQRMDFGGGGISTAGAFGGGGGGGQQLGQQPMQQQLGQQPMQQQPMQQQPMQQAQAATTNVAPLAQPMQQQQQPMQQAQAATTNVAPLAQPMQQQQQQPMQQQPMQQQQQQPMQQPQQATNFMPGQQPQ